MDDVPVDVDDNRHGTDLAVADDDVCSGRDAIGVHEAERDRCLLAVVLSPDHLNPGEGARRSILNELLAGRRAGAAPVGYRAG